MVTSPGSSPRAAGRFAPHRARVRRVAWALRPLGRRAPVEWEPDLPPVQWVQTARGETGIRVVPGPAGLPPVLLLHGVTWNAGLNFHQVIAPLAATRTVVLMDHRGHGHGMPIDNGCRIEDLADDALAVLDELGMHRVVVVGFSLGSLTALHMAVRDPARIAGLVLTAGSLTLLSNAAERLVMRLAVWGIALLARLGVGRSIAPRYFGLNRRERAAQFDRAWPWIRHELEQNDPRGLAPALRTALHHDARSHVTAISRIPSSVVVHEQDTLIPAPLQRRMARDLGATVVSIDAGHEAPLSHPEAYRDAVLEAVAALDGLAGPRSLSGRPA